MKIGSQTQFKLQWQHHKNSTFQVIHHTLTDFPQ